MHKKELDLLRLEAEGKLEPGLNPIKAWFTQWEVNLVAGTFIKFVREYYELQQEEIPADALRSSTMEDLYAKALWFWAEDTSNGSRGQNKRAAMALASQAR